MKIFHLSDLHLGKRLYEVSLIEDQAFIIDRIIDAADEHRPDVVIIAGDVYDKTVPTAEAVALFDRFLSALAARNIQTMVISGNHDSSTRLAFASNIMRTSGIHMSPVWDGTVSPITVNDSFGTVNFYLLPFIKPSHVHQFYPDENVNTYTDAVRTAIAECRIDNSERNVLVTHQFLTGASRSDSEELSVGGSDNVDVSVTDGFDYVALGHIHSPQHIGRETVRYCGTPLKYSFSEAAHRKSVTVIDMGAKGDVAVSTLPLTPLRDLREIRGTYGELTLRANYIDTKTDDYLHITLTDEDDIPDAVSKLRVIYPNLMKLDYDNTRTRSAFSIGDGTALRPASPAELFADFFKKQNNRDMDSEQTRFVKALLEKIGEEEVL